MTAVKINTEDLRQQLRAAEARQRDLATEHATNEADTREASKLAARQRADAARHGESVSAAAADMDVEELRRRRDSLPYEVWTARLTTAQLQKDLHQAELEEVQAEDQEAAADLASAQRTLKEAEDAHRQAYSRRMAVASRGDRLRQALRSDTRTIAAIEEDSPGA